ncbi:MAG: undecaprenyldiphospho-muramoylpentapeptide beta-N-acetylglucosaminyltransferase [Gammaproteobacteria bacterium]|jgi:UDP-N-acetylglucosamine--N-acetylmuramyl-(pentapeptide) pyrophosphoryl-undecaprenol N-acetylglucosamine transferase|nr:undecaprenyldiphospho-muramoylpentapeptide beta-N-acetylglucosaminyltransferase [Gammaproteobacteria bacterium]MDP6615582.1 undecaprenyldiphospho-muramoylpentapeptide beta-N-acetylglucosaminyltransferase [Gammaproteobacteria bacterium]MDP6694744.1 undecaprenyldiphospho-muramoylpentapeptide beta-N-acetylglucosaminyltransferase [Gammaproteobacteria bacterium]
MSLENNPELTGPPIMIMAGGTGGHVFPALAVAHALMKQDRRVVWLGTRAGLENRLVPGEGIPLDYIRVAGLRRKGALSWLLAPFKLVVAIWDALRVLRRRKPGVVLGMGGFVSGPGGLAAWLLRRPLVIHEQNAAAGLTNRLLAGLAREVLEAFPGSFSRSQATHTIGNPVRREIFMLAKPEERLARRAGPLRVLVLGGSQGALALNNTVPIAVALLPDGVDVDVWHQAGPATLDAALDAYQNSGVEARVDAFISDMDEAYAWADMVVCRSGALTVCELAAAGLGAVLVPYPAAVDDHQTLNARYLVDAGAAVLIPQSQLTPERLAAELEACARDRGLVLERASRARELSRPAATDDLVAACLAQEAA